MNGTGAPITDPQIEDYMSSLYPRVPEVLRDMEKRAEGSDVRIVGPLVGRFLAWMCLVSKPRSVFEMGSGFGYSALWFALSLDAGCSVTCTDTSPRNAELAGDYFARAGESEKLEFIVGDALEALENSARGFDIIFNDVDKELYPRALSVAREKLAPGGMLITDNAFWHGRVVRDDGSESARGVAEFNRAVFSDPGFVSSVVPLRDGLVLSLRI